MPQNPNNHRQVQVLGTTLDCLDMGETINYILEFVENRQASGHLVKAYVEMFERAYREPQIQQVLDSATLVVADSIAPRWAAYFTECTDHSLWAFIKSVFKIIARPQDMAAVLPESFRGANFTWQLLAACQRQNKSVFLVGSPKQNSIKTTKDFIQEQLPQLKIAGVLSGRDETGRFSPEQEAKLVQELKKHRPDIILVGLGFPLQEQVIHRVRKQVGEGFFIGEGGTFDYDVFGGGLKKAPKVLQKLNLEWLWRLVLEPKRIKRQMAIPRFMYYVYNLTKNN